jgi:hypothetical protein
MSKPLAWIGVFDGEPDPEFIWWDEAKARRWINTRPGVELAPLAIAPTLTDAEREAVRFCVTASLPETEKLGGAAGELCRMHSARLRGLLERLGTTGSV